MEKKAQVKHGDIQRVLAIDTSDGLQLLFLYKNGDVKKTPVTAELITTVSAKIQIEQVTDFTKEDL